MGFANVYRPPVRPKVGRYLSLRFGDGLWRIRHIGRKTGIITAVRNPGCVLKVHRRHLDEHFTVREGI